MGGGHSSQAKPAVVHKAGLQFPGKDSFIADEFTRWSVPVALECIYLRFEVMIDHEKPSERTVIMLQEPLFDTNKAATDSQYKVPSTWNGCKIPPSIDFIKVFIIDYHPQGEVGAENLFVYSFLVDKMFEDQIDSYLQAEDRKVRKLVPVIGSS